MDGGTVTSPNLAIFTEDGWVVENEGVPPDVEVEQTPADVINGRDPQLERAIRMALDALTPKRAAADRQVAPSNTTRTTRSRRSADSALDIPAGLPTDRQLESHS